MNGRVRGQKLVDPFRFMRRQIICLPWIFAPQLTTMSVRNATNSADTRRLAILQYLTSLGVERRVERERAVAVVLEAMAFNTTTATAVPDRSSA